jgi:hypothetical protein
MLGSFRESKVEPADEGGFSLQVLEKVDLQIDIRNQ